MKINPSGASSATARQDGLSYSGVSASYKLASNDYSRCLKYKSQFQSASASTQIPVGLITAIASRESRCGGAKGNKGAEAAQVTLDMLQVLDGISKL